MFLIIAPQIQIIAGVFVSKVCLTVRKVFFLSYFIEVCHKIKQQRANCVQISTVRLILTYTVVSSLTEDETCPVHKMALISKLASSSIITL